MKTIIAGGRDLTDYRLVEAAIALCGFDWLITEVVSGVARGIDTLGERWAEDHRIPVKRFPADWDTYGKRAGMLRNEHMAQYANALVAIPDKVSRGTRNMISLAEKHNLRIYVYEPKLVLWEIMKAKAVESYDYPDPPTHYCEQCGSECALRLVSTDAGLYRVSICSNCMEY